MDSLAPFSGTFGLHPMSMHFDIAVAFDLKASTPQEVLDTISYLVRTQDYPLPSPPEDDFF